MPFYPSPSEGHFYDIDTFYEHLVMEYTGLNFHEMDNLLYEEFLLYRRDAYIYQMQQTEEGRKYLENCFLYEKTKPDRDSLWKLKQKGVR